MSVQTPLPIVIVGHVDHGKSTLIGRLLHDTGSLDESLIAAAKAASAKRGDAIEWSFLLDALQVERDQGITVDTSRIWFRTPTRPYVIIDAPGHAEFLRNMVTGAASAAAAVLIVDAEQGLGEQTRRHSVLLSMLGVRQIVVAINKMDLVGYAQARFDALQTELDAWLTTLGLSATLTLPLAARHGENLVSRSENLSWWQGPTLIEALDGLTPPAPPAAKPLRLAVQDVYRRGTQRWAVGRIDTGSLRVGERVRILPTNQCATIAAIDVAGKSAISASAEDGVAAATAIRFASEVLLGRGQLIVPEEQDDATAAPLVDHIRLRAFWLDRDPLMAEERITVRVHTASISAHVEAIERPLSLASLESHKSQEGALIDSELGPGGFADVVLRLAQPLACDPAQPDAPTGRAVLMRGGRIAGAGLISEASRQSAARAGEAILTPTGLTNGGAPQRLGDVMWLFGLSGAGKSTIAAHIKAELALQNRAAVILDGDALRLGLNHDLGFSDEDRRENVRRTAEIAQILSRQGIDVIVAVITPSEAMRVLARRILGPTARFIHVRASLETCAARDPKGLYAKASEGKLKGMTGLAAPFEDPASPDLTLDTETLTAKAAAKAALGPVSRYDALSEGL
jgi:bifunctional enzyme CysN/CysC